MAERYILAAKKINRSMRGEKKGKPRVAFRFYAVQMVPFLAGHHPQELSQIILSSGFQ